MSSFLCQQEFSAFNSDAYLGAAQTGRKRVEKKLSEDLEVRRTQLVETKAELDAARKASSELSGK